eukprot:21032-Heterococcus_DN1.PRE.1
MSLITVKWCPDVSTQVQPMKATSTGEVVKEQAVVHESTLEKLCFLTEIQTHSEAVVAAAAAAVADTLHRSEHAYHALQQLLLLLLFAGL